MTGGPGRRGKFEVDLAAGHAGEDRVVEALLEADLPAHRSSHSYSSHDLVVDHPEGPVRVEVKFDRKALGTGNLAVEYANPETGRASGVAATRAPVWACVLADGSVWACRTGDLRRHLAKGRRAEGYRRKIERAGDGNADCVLYALRPLLAKLFFRLDGLPPAEAAALVAVLAA